MHICLTVRELLLKVPDKIFTCVTLAKVGLVVGPLCPLSIRLPVSPSVRQSVYPLATL